MIRDQQQDRTLREASLDADLVVVGGGLAGTCCAITAARQGAKVVLVQDRPVLGGNASSEVRLWVLGATSHMGSNNRWAREGGLINEILLDSVYRNPEGNPVLFDAILLDKAASEPSLTLLLNTAVHAVERRDDGGVASVRAFCSQNSTSYELRAPVFCDASGDGVVGFLAGAAFRFGAEARDEFDELYAPATEGSDLLGHSLYFYTRDTGQPVSFTAPSFALDDITTIPRYRRFSTQDQGCSLWWIEYGGLRDTVHDTEEIKWELWKVVYGVWDHIKNSGEFPDAETMTLEWIGTIPGKRESRRFEGDYMMSQRDLVERRRHNDAVSFGGWAIDHHPGEGVYSKEEPCTQWHSRGVYQIPYRCLYSRNTPNLFLAGRIISASHVAFGSTRVMATCAHLGQAVGMAAALCARDGLDPKELTEPGRIAELQNRLLQNGQHIPGVSLSDQEDLAQAADLLPSSEFVLSDLPACGDTRRLSDAMALLVPVPAGSDIEVAVPVVADGPTVLSAELRCDIDPDCYTPDRVLALEECVVGREGASRPTQADGQWPERQIEQRGKRVGRRLAGPQPGPSAGSAAQHAARDLPIRPPVRIRVLCFPLLDAERAGRGRVVRSFGQRGHHRSAAAQPEGRQVDGADAARRDRDRGDRVLDPRAVVDRPQPGRGLRFAAALLRRRDGPQRTRSPVVAVERLGRRSRGPRAKSDPRVGGTGHDRSR